MLEWEGEGGDAIRESRFCCGFHCRIHMPMPLPHNAHTRHRGVHFPNGIAEALWMLCGALAGARIAGFLVPAEPPAPRLFALNM